MSRPVLTNFWADRRLEHWPETVFDQINPRVVAKRRVIVPTFSISGTRANSTLRRQRKPMSLQSAWYQLPIRMARWPSPESP